MFLKKSLQNKRFKPLFHFANLIKSLIASKQCLTCSNINQELNSLCTDCWNQLLFINNDLTKKDFSILKWNSQTKSLIHNFKYKDKLYYGNFIANLMANFLIQNQLKFDYIVFVPISNKRILTRGFNQTSELAKIIAKKTKIKIAFNIFFRKESPFQSHLKGKKREKNIKGKIKVNLKTINIIESKSILLIDDVKTTGATLEECQKQLSKYCKNIKTLTFASTSYTNPIK